MNIGIGIALTLLVWLISGWDLIWCATAVFGAWWLTTRQTAPGAGGGGVIGRVASAVGATYGFLIRLAITLVVFVGLMMLVGRLTGVSPYWITQRFTDPAVGLGWRVWLWPANIGLPVLLFVCEVILAAGVAHRTAAGNWRTAAKIFGGFAIIAFIMIATPRIFEAARPKPASGPATPRLGETQAWADADQSVAEQIETAKKRGPLRRVGNFLWWLAVGEDGISWPSWLHWPTPPTTRTVVVSPAPSAPARGGLTPTLYKFRTSSNCLVQNLGYQARWYPKGGSVRVTRPDGTEYVDAPGVDAPITAFGPGRWQFCREDLGAIGVEIWE